PENRRRRAARDNLTPQRAYRLPILKALEILGGRASVQAVFEEVHKLMQNQLKTDDYKMVPSGKETRWMNAIRWEGYPLRQQGYLRPDLPKGIWEITDAGRALLRQLEQESSTEVHEVKETYTAEEDDEDLLWLLEEET
ncbi:MAG: winged helix-turn-helix domain-containing protein, partial [Chthonomonadaceae bacterium]|nr:winged helix-turn-helix domain-containing protein [Chthonomonadaceae bacterium]